MFSFHPTFLQPTTDTSSSRPTDNEVNCVRSLFPTCIHRKYSYWRLLFVIALAPKDYLNPKILSQILTRLRNIFHGDLAKIYVAAGQRPKNVRRLSRVSNALAKRAPKVPEHKLQNPRKNNTGNRVRFIVPAWQPGRLWEEICEEKIQNKVSLGRSPTLNVTL